MHETLPGKLLKSSQPADWMDDTKIGTELLMWLEGDPPSSLGLRWRQEGARELVAVSVMLYRQVRAGEEASWSRYGLCASPRMAAPTGWVDRETLATVSRDARVQLISSDTGARTAALPPEV
jgi:hypothetical protein